MREKILLDTDIGSDIDDAICLAYLLANPSCELIGITTVTGEANKRAMIADVICRSAGKEIPIYPGAEEPLLVDQRQRKAPQSEMLSDFNYKNDFPEGEAIDFLRRTIHQNPYQITLLSIGPLTNIALLFKTDPAIPSLLKRLVMMCGVFFFNNSDEKVEWNAAVDPHAAAIVYKKKISVHHSIGLDVTRKVIMNKTEVNERFVRHPLLKTVKTFAQVWFRERQTVTFHDILAASTIFKPEICRFTRGMVEVELQDKTLMGMTRFIPSEDGFCEVAVEVDTDLFFRHFFSLFE